MTVLCINDANRPNEIPANKWIKKGQEYTPLNVIKCNSQGGELGYVLAEIDLTGCEPYKCFSVRRFAIRVPETVKQEELELTA